MSSSGNWVLQIDESVYKFLAKISRPDRERVLLAVQDLPKDPFRGDIQKMKGEMNIWRRRVGSYRFRYELLTNERVIHVFLAERRSSKSY